MEQQTNRIFSSRIRLDILFMIFLIMQPLIDIYRTFLGDTLSIGPFAIEEIFILLFLFFLLIASSIQIFQNKTAKKVLPYLFYLLITACYLILHCLNMLQFDQTIYSASDINIVVEIYYIFRAYLCPILLSILIFQNGVSDALFFRTMKIIVCIISGIIVVTNLLGISLVAYSTEKKQIAGSIFSWPSLSIDMIEIEIEAYTSKGWFESANQIGALLFSLCPFTILCAFKKPSWSNCLLVALQGLSMIMLGSRTASWGFLLALGAMLFLALFLHLCKLEKIPRLRVLPILLAIAIFAGILSYYSPGQFNKRRNSETDLSDRPEAEIDKEEIENSSGEYEALSLEEYLEQYAFNYYIQSDYLKIYPVSGDVEFWKNVLSRDRYLNIDQRSFKIEILQRIKERNDRTADTFLGFGYTTNIPYTERDYVYQYYIFGILGVLILMGPFIYALFLGGIRMLLYPKQLLTLENCAILMALGCMLFVAFFAGHVFGILINMFFMGAYAAKILTNVKNSKNCGEIL